MIWLKILKNWSTIKLWWNTQSTHNYQMSQDDNQSSNGLMSAMMVPSLYQLIICTSISIKDVYNNWPSVLEVWEADLSSKELRDHCHPEGQHKENVRVANLEAVGQLVWFTPNFFHIKSHWKHNCSKTKQHHSREAHPTGICHNACAEAAVGECQQYNGGSDTETPQ